MPGAKKQKVIIPEARAVFASRLRERRVQAGFARARRLAQVLEIDENRYTRYERGEAEPDVTLIRKICDALRVTPDDLFGYDAPAMRELKLDIWSARLRDHCEQLYQQLASAHASVSECLQQASKVKALMNPDDDANGRR